MKICVGNPNIIAYIEGLTYETWARKSLLDFMVDHGVDLHSDSFQSYHREYLDFYAELQLAKKELANQWIVPVTGGAPCSWSLDFETGEITIREAENETEE